MGRLDDSPLLAAVRLVLVVAGVGVAVLTVQALASMPPPPPDSDGFAHGMAGLVGGLVLVVSLGLAALGVALPALVGRDDPLGFNRWQRLGLRAAGGLVVGGLALGLALGFVVGLQWGLLLWLGLVVVATLAVGAVLAWRLGEAVVRLAARAVGGEPS